MVTKRTVWVPSEDSRRLFSPGVAVRLSGMFIKVEAFKRLLDIDPWVELAEWCVRRAQGAHRYLLGLDAARFLNGHISSLHRSKSRYREE